MTQSVERLTLGFGLGDDLRVLRSRLLWSPPLSPTRSPALGSTLSREMASLLLPLPLLFPMCGCVCMHTHSLSKYITKSFKK